MRKILLVSFLATFLLIGISFMTMRPYFTRVDAIASITTQMVPVGPITKGIMISEEIPDNLSNANQISLFMATYGRTNTDKVMVTIKSFSRNKWDTIAKYSLYANIFHDNSYHAFKFPMIKSPNHRLIDITISSPDGTDNNAITAWTTSVNSNNRKAVLFVDGKRQPRVIPVNLESNESYNLLNALAILSSRILPLQNPFVKYVFIFIVVMGFWLTLALVAMIVGKQNLINEQ